LAQVSLYPGDNRETLKRLIAEGVRVHSVVTDPPYGLVSIQKRFGKEGSAAARTEGNDGSFARLSGGFMNAKWDATGIERDPEFWRLVYDILLPGGYVFAFSGSRTGHWQACAMETAGFVMHPMHGWVFGSGFPKAHSARDAGSEWEGWAYGTQTQKPALEPIYLGQRPFSEKNGILNIQKHGVGAVNIDGCRVPAPGEVVENHGRKPTDNGWDIRMSGGQEKGQTAGQALGRYPSNLILDGSPEVVAMFPDSKGQQGAVRGDEPSGVTKEIYGKFNGRVPAPVRGDSGSAARFFHQFGPDADPLFCHPKAGKLDRAGSKHPTVKPIALMQYLIRHITPPGGVVLDPFAGSGTTGEAALREGFDCILMEAEPDYLTFLEQRFQGRGVKMSHDVDSLIYDDYDPLADLLG
jgi:site-specific DNA-methyltransferase (adenine-specific)